MVKENWSDSKENNDSQIGSSDNHQLLAAKIHQVHTALVVAVEAGSVHVATTATSNSTTQQQQQQQWGEYKSKANLIDLHFC